jgi:hypothetical protein
MRRSVPATRRYTHLQLAEHQVSATHAFVNDLVGRKLWFSIGFDCESRVQRAILDLPEQAFTAALDANGQPRHGAWVAELASSGWPQGTRAICRRERPHPGAAHKLAFTDAAGHRFQVFITNQADPDAAFLEARHRPEPTSRTASAVPRPPACGTCPSSTSAPTTPGSPWS